MADLGLKMALGAGKPFVAEGGKWNWESMTLVVNRDVWFITGFYYLVSVGNGEDFGIIKGVADGAR